MMRLYQVRALLFSPAVLLPLFLATAHDLSAKPNGKRTGGQPPPAEFQPLALAFENYFFRVPGETSCLGEDDELEWHATGSLAPGESFTFTPDVPACNSHAAAITVVATWRGGALDLSSVVPDVDYSSWDAEQAGRVVAAPVVGESAQLCMFPAFTGDGVGYTITVTNNSAEAVHEIHLEGRHENDWPLFYYPRCLNADGDGDGWNDSLEHTMANLVYPNGYIDGEFQPDILWGSNYLRGKSRTPTTEDEIDSYPADFNDDGQVNAYDVDLLAEQVGQGNGIPLERISPNPGPAWFHENTLPWRRYDLDADGYVGPEDLHILDELIGSAAPMTIDIVSPTARVVEPSNGARVPRGQYVLIRGHVWDNAAIAAVEYRVDGRSICTVSEPRPSFGFDSPFYFCWWEVPRRATTYGISVHVTDASGNTGYSPLLEVRAE